jgi:hypothetical protein
MNQLLFVDLVRNITDTEGDGPFVLGDAVRGFEDFKARVMVGDRFYYSCNGIDHPRERESCAHPLTSSPAPAPLALQPLNIGRLGSPDALRRHLVRSTRSAGQAGVTPMCG